MRDKVDYRDTLQALNERFPDKYILSQNEIAAFLGCTARTVRRKFPSPREVQFTKPVVARMLS